MDLTDKEIANIITASGISLSRSRTMVNDNNKALDTIGFRSFTSSISFFEATRLLLNQANALSDEDLACRIVQSKMLLNGGIITDLLSALRSYRTSHVPESNANDPAPLQASNPVG